MLKSWDGIQPLLAYLPGHGPSALRSSSLNFHATLCGSFSSVGKLQEIKVADIGLEDGMQNGTLCDFVRA